MNKITRDDLTTTLTRMSKALTDAPADLADEAQRSPDLDIATNMPLRRPRSPSVAIRCQLACTCPRTLGPSLDRQSPSLKAAIRDARSWLAAYRLRFLVKNRANPQDPVDEASAGLAKEIDLVISYLGRLAKSKKKLPKLPLIWHLGVACISIRARVSV